MFRNEEIGLGQMDEEVHRVFFCKTELCEFNSSEMGFRPAIRARSSLERRSQKLFFRLNVY